MTTSLRLAACLAALALTTTAFAAVPDSGSDVLGEPSPSGTPSGLPAVTSGELPGPAVLYGDAPTAPQLENTGIWEAEPLLVSGATAYRAGEWLYQDWLLDDHGARGVADRNSPYSISHHLYSPAAGSFTYPTGDGYVHNAADLVELRARLVGDQLAFRVTLNSLVDPDLAAFTIALEGQGAQAPVAWPHGAGISSPATRFLTVHGDELELTDAAGNVLREGTATVDLERNQVEARVPLADLDLFEDELRVTIGVGLWDADAGAYLAPRPGLATATTPGGGSARGTAIVNVGPRLDAQEPTPFVAGLTMGDTAAGAAVFAAWWREQAQAEALTVGDVTEFSQVIELDRLRDGVTDESDVPTSGPINRIFASHHSFGEGIDLDRICFGISAGIDLGVDCEGRQVGQLEHYAIHVPDAEAPPQGWGVTLLLHSLSANYNQYLASQNMVQLAERGTGHLVVTPGGRGPDGFYKGFAETDTFEVWNDVARHYALDGDRAAVSGYSMGGFGTYRLLARWPDLFANGFSVVANAGSVADQLVSLRNHRLLTWNAAGDELVQVTTAEEAHRQLLAAGVDHDYWLFPGADHLSLAANDAWGPGANYLEDSVVDRSPRSVSYVVDPDDDNAAAGMVANAAYWLSGLTLVDADANGTVHAFVGLDERTTTPTGPEAGVLLGGQQPMPYVARGLVATTPDVPRPDRLTLDLTNLSRVVVDPARAGVTCDVELVVQSDSDATIVLDGCDRHVEVRAIGG